MPSESLVIFEKAFLKSKFSENILKKPRILKKKPQGNCRIATMASPLLDIRKIEICT
jgi:hypothetical protein